jgi:hypothetical protein
LLQKLAAGETETELLNAYPQLSKADLAAVWAALAATEEIGLLNPVFLGDTAQDCEVFLSERETFSEPINDLVEFTCSLEVMKIRGHGACPAYYRKAIVSL